MKQKNTQCNFASEKHLFLYNQHSLKMDFIVKNESIILTSCKNTEQSDSMWHNQDSENREINLQILYSKMNKTFMKEYADKQMYCLRLVLSLLALEPRYVDTSVVFSLLHLSLLQTTFSKQSEGKQCSQLHLPQLSF